ncbi:TPA: FlhC family transcriptional regulator [Salmonella enterica subsp. enterica serovar Muenchen]|nr:hypothetical protein [Salmonella enterica]
MISDKFTTALPTGDESHIRTLISAYRVYLKYMDEGTEVLSLTRVWLLMRFIDARMLCLTPSLLSHSVTDVAEQ